MRMEENIIQDSTEIEIRTKYINNCYHMMDIFFWIIYGTAALFIIFILYPMALDFIMPLKNETRIHIIHYVIIFSYNRIIYFDILSLNFMFVGIFGSLSITCTESIFGFFSFHASILFKIISYRIQKIVTYLSILNLSSKQIDKKLTELYRVVDIHNQAIGLINILINNSGTQFILSSLLCVISMAICLYRLVNAIIAKKDQLEILISSVFLMIQLMIIFLYNYNNQILIDNSQELLNELYISTWYFVPLKVQKILLLIMIRSSTLCMFHILGVFIPCYTGFSKILSTSFSYFTMIYSIQ
ncbi:uncharacterized protein LOC107996974 [Apis cerana]|uniref:uncharacterized protein LOC107996974 n=1 Tax=Apis cerana TaxID=7461 RepID=UPI0007E2C6FC|nr:uncharacterized protein LOC107996974 [Apis cerana]